MLQNNPNAASGRTKVSIPPSQNNTPCSKFGIALTGKIQALNHSRITAEERHPTSNLAARVFTFNAYVDRPVGSASNCRLSSSSMFRLSQNTANKHVTTEIIAPIPDPIRLPTTW